MPTGTTDLTVLYERLGDIAVETGQLDTARALFEQALAIVKTLAAKDEDHVPWQRSLAALYYRLGEVTTRAGQLEAACAWVEQSLAIRKALAAKTKDNHDGYDLAIWYRRLAKVAVQAGQLDAARAWFERALTARELLDIEGEGNADWQHDLAGAYRRLGAPSTSTRPWRSTPSCVPLASLPRRRYSFASVSTSMLRGGLAEALVGSTASAGSSTACEAASTRPQRF